MSIKCLTCGAKLKVLVEGATGIFPCPKCRSMVPVGVEDDDYCLVALSPETEEQESSWRDEVPSKSVSGIRVASIQSSAPEVHREQTLSKRPIRSEVGTEAPFWISFWFPGQGWPGGLVFIWLICLACLTISSAVLEMDYVPGKFNAPNPHHSKWIGLFCIVITSSVCKFLGWVPEKGNREGWRLKPWRETPVLSIMIGYSILILSGWTCSMIIGEQTMLSNLPGFFESQAVVFACMEGVVLTGAVFLGQD